MTTRKSVEGFCQLLAIYGAISGHPGWIPISSHTTSSSVERVHPCQVQCDAFMVRNLLLLNTVGKVIDMDVLSNDVLLTIFDKFGRERAREVRCTVSLVCKRWRDALYGAKGDVEHFEYTPQCQENSG